MVYLYSNTSDDSQIYLQALKPESSKMKDHHYYTKLSLLHEISHFFCIKSIKVISYLKGRVAGWGASAEQGFVSLVSDVLQVFDIIISKNNVSVEDYLDKKTSWHMAIMTILSSIYCSWQKNQIKLLSFIYLWYS